MKSSFHLLLALTSLFVSIAQEPIQRDSITELDEVILLDSLQSATDNGIITTKIIGTKVFQNYSPVDMVSAINQISGVYILSGALNTNRITIRGVGARTLFGTDKLRLYYNDIPITNGSGFSTIESFDLENLSSVEVIKGPKATNYGANLGGAILLNSKQPTNESTYFRNNFTVGSYSLVKNNLQFSLKENKVALNFHYGFLETDGYRENNRFKREGLLLDMNYQITPKTNIGLLFNHVDYNAQIPSSLGETDFRENPTKAAFTWKSAKGYEDNKYSLAGLTLNHAFSVKISNTTSIFYSYLDHYEPRPFGILEEYTNGYGFRTKFAGQWAANNSKIDYNFGAELYKDEYQWSEFENLYQDNNGQGSLQGDQFADNKEFRRQFNAFGNLLIPFGKAFSTQIGLNVNKTYYDFRDEFNQGADNKSAERNFDAIVLPSLNLNYNFSATKSIYANISRGFSNPTVEETLTPDGVINPDIAQETGVNYEIGSKLLLLDRKLIMNLALYRMDIKNLLVAQRVGEDQYIGKNAGKTQHQGLELDAEYKIDISSKLRVTPFISYTYNDHSFVTFVDGDDDYSGNPLTGVPKHRLNSGLQAQLNNRFYWYSTHQYVGEIPLTDANELYSEAFNVVNSKVGYKNQLGKKLSMDIAFGINNIFDRNYAQSVLINTTGFGGAEPRYYYPGNDRNYYGSLRLGYSL
ncbi:TonB-dependent receptor [Arenibacter troitsensis]|uniref:Iron complex outermembrane recepter protein n=1 Tax=Arenibacter troitsensis TaxID=188872 RepID=A0A1X7JVV7_9FLAO|nr:TonB-dependent receptor [Arenibacter troitsensis]SMG31845.1 iron complex outermembrane recepter protein [Arenibacter troitsensis]